jgi:hypothetical protein
MTAMSDENNRHNSNGHLRWIAVGVIMALGAAFTGAYNFFSGQFASKTEVSLIREEQQRRTSTVYAVPNRLDEFERKVELLRLDIKQLELAVAELRAVVLQRRPLVDPSPRFEERAPSRSMPRPSSSSSSTLPPGSRWDGEQIHPTWPASGAPARVE